MANSLEPTYLSVAEVARLCRVTKCTILKWVKAGKVIPPPCKIGRRFLFPARELHEHLKQQRIRN